MLILGAVGLQIRLSDCSTFNVPLDLWSLAKQECFCRKDTTNETLQSDFPFFSFLFVRFVLFLANCTPTFLPIDYQWVTVQRNFAFRLSSLLLLAVEYL